MEVEDVEEPEMKNRLSVIGVGLIDPRLWWQTE